MKVSMTTEVTNKTREQEAWGTKEAWAQSTVNENSWTEAVSGCEQKSPGESLCCRDWWTD